jgi:hypothetical protein
MRSRAKRISISTLAIALGLAALGGSATAAGPRVVHYRSYAIRVPAGWPVYRLTPTSHVCVRFDRHAIYLGAPSSQQACPAAALGHTEAILVQPGRTSGDGAAGGAGSTSFHTHGLAITATWLHNRGLVRWALGVRTLPRASSSVPPASTSALSSPPPDVAPAIYQGEGFDTCAAPSRSTMQAWRHSHYRAIGVYIGGYNRTCAQPNLTRGWVSAETAAGWRLILIYPGLQAPVNRCGCTGIKPRRAATQGQASARDAMRRARTLGIGPGSAIYFDMEGYSETRTNRKTVLKFLAAWTRTLEAGGYVSGAHGSIDAGVDVLVSRWGTGYPEPEDLLYSYWDGKDTTHSPGLPRQAWNHHQRIHQYLGPHNVDVRGHTLNIDNDDVNALVTVAGQSSASG